MIQITEYLTTKVSKSKIKATDKTIRQIVKEEMDKYGHDCDLNHIDVSNVTNMDAVFSCYEYDLGESYSDLNPDISEWNVSNVTDIGYMFFECKNFNCDISKWDVSNVQYMRYMFYHCEKFNQYIGKWDVSNVTDMAYMFYVCKNFNQNLSDWNVMKVRDMTSMFAYCKKFNQDLSEWDVRNVREKISVFYDCPIEEKYKPHFSI